MSPKKPGREKSTILSQIKSIEMSYFKEHQESENVELLRISVVNLIERNIYISCPPMGVTGTGPELPETALNIICPQELYTKSVLGLMEVQV